MRAAEEIQTDAAADDFFLHIREVDFVAAVFQLERTVDQTALQTVDEIAEGIVDRPVD